MTRHLQYLNKITNQNLNEETIFYQLPFANETNGMKLENIRIMPSPTFPFSPNMFSDFEFLLRFYNRCIFNPNSLLSTLYLSSLCCYVSTEEFALKFMSNKSVFSNFMDEIKLLINPFDTIQILYDKLSMVNNIPSIEEKYQNFGVIKNDRYEHLVYLSKPMGENDVFKFIIETNKPFSGYIGLVNDTDDLTFNVNYCILELPSGTLYPTKEHFGVPKSLSTTLTVEVSKKKAVPNSRHKNNQLHNGF